jgi:hypothetical protein
MERAAKINKKNIHTYIHNTYTHIHTYTHAYIHTYIHATGWTVRGSNPGGDEIFRTRPNRPWGSPILLYNRHRVFRWGKAAEAWR